MLNYLYIKHLNNKFWFDLQRRLTEQENKWIVRFVFPWASAPVESCWFTFSLVQVFQDNGIIHRWKAMVKKWQQPRHLSRGVHRFGVSRQQSVNHVVHHRGQVCRRLFGHSGHAAAEGWDVRLPIILSDIRGKSCQGLVSVARSVITGAKDTWQEGKWRGGANKQMFQYIMSSPDTFSP